MPTIPYVQNDFRKGRLGKGMRTRQDTKAYQSSLRDAENMMVTADGRLLRRWGTIVKERIYKNAGRLESWDFAAGDTTRFLLLFQEKILRIIDLTGVTRKTFTNMPWLADAVDFLVVASQRTQIIITDASIRTVIVTYDPVKATFSWAYFSFGITKDNSRVQAPFWRFVPETTKVYMTNYASQGSPTGYGDIINQALKYPDTSFNLTAGTGQVAVTTDLFLPAHVGTRMRVAEGEFEITAVTDARHANVKIWRDVRSLLDPNPFFLRQGGDIVQVGAPKHGLVVGAKVIFGNLADDDAVKLLVHSSKTALGAAGVVSTISGSAAYRVTKIVDDNFFEVDADGPFVIADGQPFGSPTWVRAPSAGANRVLPPTTGLFGGQDVFMIAVDGIPGIMEPAFGVARGWPQCCVWHETRLWMGGSPGLPDAMFGSRFAEPTNFDTGTGEVTDAVQVYGIGQQARIRHMISAFDLIVLTDTAEFYIPGSADSPITQERVRGVEATSYGASYSSPKRFDGGTVFVETSGLAVRDMTVADRNSEYEAPPLSVAVPEWVNLPKHIAVYSGSYKQATPYLILTNSGDGSALVLHSAKADDSFGFMRWTLDNGAFHSFAGIGSRLFALADRDGTWYLVEFDTASDVYVTTDFSERVDLDAPVSQYASAYQAGHVVQLYSGGRFYSDVTPAADGLIILPEPLAHFVFGDSMTYQATFHPPPTNYGGTASAIGKHQRIVSVKIAWDNTETGMIDRMQVLSPLDNPLFQEVTPVNEWREYHVGIFGREPVLVISGNDPGRLGIQSAAFVAKF